MGLALESHQTDVEPFHLTVGQSGVSELFLVVGGDEGGDVTFPGLLAGRGAMEQNQGVRQPIHLGQMSHMDSPSTRVVVAGREKIFYQLEYLCLGICPDGVKQREGVSVKPGLDR